MQEAVEPAKAPPVNPNPAPSPISGVPPPVEHQFRPGDRGNPHGRPRGASVLAPMLRELAKGCVIGPDGEVLRYGDKAEALAAQILQAAQAGDRQGVDAVLAVMERSDGPVVKEQRVAYEQVREGLTLVKVDGPPPPLPVEDK